MPTAAGMGMPMLESWLGRLEPMSVNEAIAAMEQSDSAHWIFVDRESGRVTVVYRKPDKTFGVVESIS